VHAAVEHDRVLVAVVAQVDGARVGHDLVTGEHGDGVAVEVDPVVDQELGEALGVLVLAGVVDRLGHLEEVGQRGHVVGAQPAGGQPDGQRRKSRHEAHARQRGSRSASDYPVGVNRQNG
jgi:hypothetical protein